jgi:hypothetical protein
MSAIRTRLSSIRSTRQRCYGRVEICMSAADISVVLTACQHFRSRLVVGEDSVTGAADASPRLGALKRSAKSSGRKTKIRSPTQVRARLFGRNVSVGLRDIIDAGVAVVDGQESGIGRRIHMNGRRI